MDSKQRSCARCGRLISTNELSLGSGMQPTCQCPRPATRRQSTRQTPTQNITYVSSTPSIAEQLEQEFQTLKNRLISGGNA